ncbi:MAG: hypothetical protein K6F77_00525 [Lachnospiraceae bacterium]|nr:hypothetical protein [Lachnospiraceae bacterium]
MKKRILTQSRKGHIVFFLILALIIQVVQSPYSMAEAAEAVDAWTYALSEDGEYIEAIYSNDSENVIRVGISVTNIYSDNLEYSGDPVEATVEGYPEEEVSGLEGKPEVFFLDSEKNMLGESPYNAGDYYACMVWGGVVLEKKFTIEKAYEIPDEPSIYVHDPENLYYGKSLKNFELYIYSTPDVPGKWSWKNPDMIPKIGDDDAIYTAIFTPSESSKNNFIIDESDLTYTFSAYEIYEGISKYNPMICESTPPSFDDVICIKAGQKLSDIEVPTLELTNCFSGEKINGKFCWDEEMLQNIYGIGIDDPITEDVIQNGELVWVDFIPEDTDNYEAIGGFDLYCPVIIKKRAYDEDYTFDYEPEIVEDDLIYDTEPQELLEEGELDSVVLDDEMLPTIKYAYYKGTNEGESLDSIDLSELSWSESVPEVTDAGLYHLWYMIEGNSYCEGMDPVYLGSKVIEKAKLDCKTSTDDLNIDVAYDGYSHQLEVDSAIYHLLDSDDASIEIIEEVLSKEGTLYYSDQYIDSSNYKDLGTTEVPSFTDVVDTTVYYYFEHDNLYYNGQVSVDINKIDFDPDSIEAIKECLSLNSSLIYNGQSQALINEDNIDALKEDFWNMQFEFATEYVDKCSEDVIPEDLVYSEEIPQRTDRGNYCVYMRISDNKNYNDLEIKLCEVSILAAYAELKVTDYNGTYDGNGHGLNVSLESCQYIDPYEAIILRTSEIDEPSTEDEIIETTEFPLNYVKIYYSTKNELDDENYQEAGDTEAPTLTEVGTIENVYYYAEVVCDNIILIDGCEVGSGSITITKADIFDEPSAPDTEYEVDYVCKTVGETDILEGDWKWSDDTASLELPVGEAVTGTAVYTGQDVNNYTSDSIYVSIKRSECAHQSGLTKVEANAATCTEAGNTEYYYCKDCGRYYADADGEKEIEKGSWIIPATGHEYGKPSYKWSDSYDTCTATVTCLNCDEDCSEHEVTETVNTISEVTALATLDEMGEIVYTAMFANSLFKAQTIAISIPKLNPEAPEESTGKITVPEVPTADITPTDTTPTDAASNDTALTQALIGQASVTQAPATQVENVTPATTVDPNTIHPRRSKLKKVKIKSVKRIKKHEFDIMWIKVAKADGYQVQYSEYESFSTKISKTINDGKKHKTRIKKYVKADTDYYVRVRAYKESDGDVTYGKWSNICKVKN